MLYQLIGSGMPLLEMLAFILAYMVALMLKILFKALMQIINQIIVNMRDKYYENYRIIKLIMI